VCGIAGILCSRGTDTAQVGASLLRVLTHRGPDDHGWLSLRGTTVCRGRDDAPPADADVLLLHRRLSILDLSDAGWQPMSTPDGRYHLVFNGEIYNYLELRTELKALGHQFHSHSDTEVLLHAWTQWGERALVRLVGMFAFALLDTQTRRLLLARDCFGIKPLYYAHCRGGFAFASEVKALLEVPGISRRVNPQRLYDYLRRGCTDHGDETLFADVSQLPPAHFLRVSLDQPAAVHVARYWWPPQGEPLDISLDEATARLREMFLESIRLHLRSDVPVGAALSGGIDSSAIVTAMRHVEPRLDLHTFSYVADDPALSEERWARSAGGRAGATLHTVTATPDELAADLDRLIRLQDEPFGSTSIYAQYRVFGLAREAGIKVMLDGQGADELLGGYRPYLAARLASLVRGEQWGEAVRFLRQAAGLPGSGGIQGVLLHTTGLLCPPPLQGLARRLAGKSLMPPWLNRRWFTDRGVRPRGEAGSGRPRVLHEQLRRALAETSLPMLLRYEDRNSMAHSIESRVPFLTPALVEFVLRLPEGYLIAADGTTKDVFRRAMRGIVPDEVLDRRDKIGFATPESRWLVRLRPWVDAVLAGDAARRVPPLVGSAMRREWRGVLDGRRTFDFRIWRWVNLIRWAELLGVQFDG
jgi:asparagine synthase (glutamine-hydrolysing)